MEIKQEPSNYIFDYVDLGSVNPNLLCMICCSPFIEPVESPCGHCYCHHCISAWMLKESPASKSFKCPQCRSEHSITALTKSGIYFRKILDDVPVYCTNKQGKQKCNWTGPRSNLHNHLLLSCNHNPCPNAPLGCLWEGASKQLKGHLESCNKVCLNWMVLYFDVLV